MKALLVAAALLAAVVVGGGCGESASTSGTIGIHHSRFDRDVITARAGQPLTITVRNGDPIEHEWIVGTAEVHERHRTGTESYHDQVPTEVTVPPYSEKVTTVTFKDAGDYQYICHLPGHEAYGMRGTIRVR